VVTGRHKEFLAAARAPKALQADCGNEENHYPAEFQDDGGSEVAADGGAVIDRCGDDQHLDDEREDELVREASALFPRRLVIAHWVGAEASRNIGSHFIDRPMGEQSGRRRM
jgi:hypothetical protein